MSDLPELEHKSVEALIFDVRGQRVILDSDLAGLFGTNTRQLNQQVKRNIARFDEQFAFQLTRKEFAELKSSGESAKTRHGGRRIAPWAFTEHGIPMAATVLRTGRAVEALKLVIKVFVDARRQMLSGAKSPALPETERTRMQGMRDKLIEMADAIMDAELNKRDRTTVRDEVEKMTVSVLDNVKAQLDAKPLQNEAVIAEIQKQIAETEKLRAETRRTDAETDTIDLKNMRERLELLQSIQSAIDTETTGLWAAMDQLGQTKTVTAIAKPHLEEDAE